MHVGEMLVFQAPDSGFDYDRLVTLIRRRIAFVPRYRQRVRWVPGRLANPVGSTTRISTWRSTCGVRRCHRREPMVSRANSPPAS